ncbi:CCA tRNA nucleotidyltransferase [Campylobacter sp. faydin G-105]|uniref:CCA tRNA nucleotidyltransferase n=1 Tax=Campylobacter anatolicus TaxID=2829105 RepID=UPI001B9A59EF|nr:CCA tRNA nucleotidyltransferase [Campylobacter anatolicus]
MLKTDLKIYQNNKLDVVRDLLAPYTNRAYLVGGCVRDALLGRAVSDYDIEVYDINPQKFDTLMSEYGANGVGKSYFIYKFKNFDLGLPRSENRTGLTHKDFDVSYINEPRQACLRRDFSVNAMMINIFNGEFLDFFGGVGDLENRVLMHIDDKKFCEDPLRVLRGVQFSSRLGFYIAPKTLELMNGLSLAHLSKDRINTELIKFFRAKHLYIGARYLYELGLLGELFGKFVDGKFAPLLIPQDEFDKFNNELKNAREFVADERLFIYLICGYFCLDVELNLNRLKMPKSFLSVVKQPYFKDEPSDKELLRIALKMPLKEWLGLKSKELIKRAKNLGVYDTKFDAKTNTQEILKAGFSGKAVGVEIARRQDIAIDKFLNLQLKTC